MAESRQEKENRLRKQSIEFEKEQRGLAQERSKVEKEILNLFKEQVSVGEIMSNLQRENSKELEETTDSLKSSNEILQESVKGLVAKLQLQKKLTGNESALAKISERQAEIKKNIKATTDKSAISGMKSELGQLVLGKKNIKQAERINILAEALPDFIGNAVGSVSHLAGFLAKAGPVIVGLVAVGALLKLTVGELKEMESEAEQFRKETGLGISQTKELFDVVKSTVGQYRLLGVTFEDAFAIAKSFKNEFGDVQKISESVLETAGVLSANFAVSGENTIKLLRAMESTSGFTSDAAESSVLLLTNTALLAGVAPAKVFADIAESSEEMFGFVGGITPELTSQAVQLRRIGSSLKEAAAVAKGLLDFESSITAELETSVFLGRNLDLSRARQLAFVGDFVGQQSEILNQVEKLGPLTQFNAIQLGKIEESTGSTIESLSRQLMIRQKLGKLEPESVAAFEKLESLGLSLNKITESNKKKILKEIAELREMQSVFTDIDNIWGQIKVTAANAFIPALKGLAEFIKEGIKTNEFKETIDTIAQSVVTFGKIITRIFDDPIIKAFGVILLNILKLMNFIEDTAERLTGHSLLGLLNPLTPLIDTMKFLNKNNFDAGSAVSYQGGMPVSATSFRPEQQDFISRPGQKPTPFSENDTIVGTKTGFGFGNLEKLLMESNQLNKQMLVAIQEGKIIQVDGVKMNRSLAFASQNQV